VLKHIAANRKRRLSVLPNLGPYIYDVKLLLLLVWRYSPAWALASLPIHLQTSRSLALPLHSLIPIFIIKRLGSLKTTIYFDIIKKEKQIHVSARGHCQVGSFGFARISNYTNIETTTTRMSRSNNASLPLEE
jgi:hypothetical protein